MFKFDKNNKYKAIATYVVIALLIAAFGVILLISLISDGLLFSWIGKFFDVIAPVVYGFFIAYLVNPVMKFCEKYIFRFTERKKPHPKLRHILSVIAAFLFILLLLFLFFILLIPQIVSSYTDLSTKMEDYISSAQSWADTTVKNIGLFGFRFENLSDFLSTTNFAQSLKNLISDSGDVFQTIASYVIASAGKIVIGLKNGIIGFILAIYFLLKKDKLIAQSKKLLAAICKPTRVRTVLRESRRINQTFGGFITGKLLDSLIIGLLSFIIFAIFAIPYYPLIALIVGVTNIIPIIGPIIGAIPCAFIIFIAEPSKVFWFIIMIIVIQQIDGNLIGPKILGDSTGLSSMWVLISITIAGSLFGLTGMFLGVPLFAVLYSWIKNLVERKLVRSHLPHRTTDYYEGEEGALYIESAGTALDADSSSDGETESDVDAKLMNESASEESSDVNPKSFFLRLKEKYQKSDKGKHKKSDSSDKK